MDEPGRGARAAGVLGATAAAAATLVWSWRAVGPGSRRFAFVAVWAPMTWLGVVSRVLTPRLPEPYHRLRTWELGGARLYELLGVRVAKSALRRGPLARFNPGLHLPSDPTPERIAQLDQRMRDAEASHALLFAATSGLALAQRARGRRSAARWMVLWNVVMNGYPVMLQRYNRGVLATRFATLQPADGPSRVR